MEGYIIGCSGITWRRAVPQEQILAEVAQAGYEGSPAGMREGQTAQQAIELFSKYGLKPASPYLGAMYWEKDQAGEILQKATALAKYTAELGCTEMYVAATCTRRELSARVRPENALSAEQYRQFADTLNRVGEIALKQGVKICFHNHVGSYIETRQEIDTLFSLVDRSLVFQGPDIGHLAWGGGDVVQFCKDYADSIKTVHIKDINPKIMPEGIEKGWDYATFSAHGIFAEIGEGFVDFPGMFDVLQKANYKGWIIVETDVTQKATPLESALISRKYLKSIGY